MGTLVVSDLRISARTAAKLLNKHGLHAEEVRAAVENVGRLRFRWHEHPERGRRAIVETYIREQQCLVVLYPAALENGETWNLGSAYLVGHDKDPRQ